MSTTTHRVVAYECRRLILSIGVQLQGKLPPQLLFEVPKLECGHQTDPNGLCTVFG